MSVKLVRKTGLTAREALMGNRMKALHAGGIVILLAAFSWTGAANAAAPQPAAATDSPAYSDNDSSANPLGWQTNIELIKNLNAQDRCLFQNSVFPAGGVGYKDSSLPYDEYEPIDAAFLTVRAELIRNNPDTVSGVTLDRDSNRGLIQIIPETANRLVGLDKLVASDERVAEAVRTLAESGVTFSTATTGRVSIITGCEISDAVSNLKASDGTPINSGTNRDPGGVVQVTLTKSDLSEKSVQELIATFGDQIHVTPIDSEMMNFNRVNDIAPN